MKRVAWLTDIHLNFLDREGIRKFCEEVCRHPADAVVISGDIAEGHNLLAHLYYLKRELSGPVYFVLGNHDFYRSSIAEVRRLVCEFCARTPSFAYLTCTGAIELTPNTALVGHDGWADARCGDFANSNVWLNDYLLIREITTRNKTILGPLLQQLGDEAAAHFRRVLPALLGKYRNVVVATHVPPFPEACSYNGRLANGDWLPHFTCQAVGEALREMMSAHPDRLMTVLCGHTHGRSEVQILPNLQVLTGGAAYNQPELQRVLIVE